VEGAEEGAEEQRVEGVKINKTKENKARERE
jgi:hypothetical protein